MQYLRNHLTNLKKIDTAMHISHPNLTGDQIFENLKIQDSGPRPFSKSNNVQYLQNRLVDFDEIVHDEKY